MIELGENFITDIIGYIKTLFADFSLLIYLVMGIGLAIIIVEAIIQAITSKKE